MISNNYYNSRRLLQNINVLTRNEKCLIVFFFVILCKFLWNRLADLTNKNYTILGVDFGITSVDIKNDKKKQIQIIRWVTIEFPTKIVNS